AGQLSAGRPAQRWQASSALAGPLRTAVDRCCRHPYANMCRHSTTVVARPRGPWVVAGSPGSVVVSVVVVHPASPDRVVAARPAGHAHRTDSSAGAAADTGRTGLRAQR